MQDHFSLKVNEQFDFEISRKETEDLDVLKLKDSKLHLIKNQKSYTTEILKSDFSQKKYIVEVNANIYEVNISDDLDLLIKEMGFEVGETKKANAVHAPMPGLILDIMVKPGDEIIENQALLILEAMKMENVISAPRDAVVKEVHVTKGQAIENKYLLIEFE